MLNNFKPISISLSPNVQKDDVTLALKLIFQLWNWKRGSAIKNLEDEFKKYLSLPHAFSFNSGRSSLYAILKALDLPKESGVLLQAFTCNAVANPILWAGLNPVYIDCGNDFNINVNNLKSQILNLKTTGQNVKVLILQHTFGLPANIDEVLSIVRQNNMVLIEDCAHALGAKYQGKKVGTFSDAAFFSFSRDKVISSVYGGMAVTNNEKIARQLEKMQKEFGYPSYFWIFQQLLHPLLLDIIILPMYHFLDLGKIFLVLSQWFNILSKAVSWQEKRGVKPDYFPKALPNALAIMAQKQFDKLETFNAHRQKIAEFYYHQLQGTKFGLPEKEGNIFLRFAVTHPEAHEIIYEAWHAENMLLGDWYTTPIAPDDTQSGSMCYTAGMCKNAESLAKKTLNLPTHINISMKDAKRIISFLKKFT